MILWIYLRIFRNLKLFVIRVACLTWIQLYWSFDVLLQCAAVHGVCCCAGNVLLCRECVAVFCVSEFCEWEKRKESGGGVIMCCYLMDYFKYWVILVFLIYSFVRTCPLLIWNMWYPSKLFKNFPLFGFFHDFHSTIYVAICMYCEECILKSF
jgi:hypothetical protein